MMTHNCGKPESECTCLTQSEFDSLSPKLQRIVRNAHRQGTALTGNREPVGSDEDMDMVPPTVNHAEEFAERLKENERRGLTRNIQPAAEASRLPWDEPAVELDD